MSEKKELNQEQLETVSGGAGRYQAGKYYADLYLKTYQNSVGGNLLGPYDSEQEAKTAGENFIRNSSQSFTQATIKIKYYNEDGTWTYGVPYNFK